MGDEPDDAGESRQGEEELPEPDADDAEREGAEGAGRVARKGRDDRRQDAGLDDGDRRRGKADDEGGAAEERRDDPPRDGADEAREGAPGGPPGTERGGGEDARADAERDREAGGDRPGGDFPEHADEAASVPLPAGERFFQPVEEVGGPGGETVVVLSGIGHVWRRIYIPAPLNTMNRHLVSRAGTVRRWDGAGVPFPG